MRFLAPDPPFLPGKLLSYVLKRLSSQPLGKAPSQIDVFDPSAAGANLYQIHLQLQQILGLIILVMVGPIQWSVNQFNAAAEQLKIKKEDMRVLGVSLLDDASTHGKYNFLVQEVTRL